MGSSSRWLRKVTALGASAALLIAMAGCNSVAAPRDGDIGPFATGLHGAGAGASGVPGSGAVSSGLSGTVNNITARFDYRDRLITPLAHLYGKFLADFVIVTIKNGNTS